MIFKKCFFLYIIFLFAINVSSQIECYNKEIADCEIYKTHVIYDYFNQRYDSVFCEYGRAILIDCYSLFFDTVQPVYTTRKTTYQDGSGVLDVFIDDKLLFSYEMHNGKIEGIGRIYYYKTGMVAYQGVFLSNRLNGQLFYLSDSKRGVIYSMMFKDGKPVKILYVWNYIQTQKTYRKINKRKYFKKGKSTSVISYPF